MSYEYFYPGSPNSLNPYSDSLFTGYKAPLAGLALTTDGRMGNQLQEVSNKLNTGIKVLEISGSDPGLMDSIPKQQFQEINRLVKLTGAETTLHGPQVEASGYAREGWSEAGRQSVERQMESVLERAHSLSPDGNIPVTFHATAMLPSGEQKVMEKVEGVRKPVSKEFYIVDPRTGQMANPLKPTERFFPGETDENGKPLPFNPQKELDKTNKDIWSQELGNINFSALRGEQEIERIDNPEIFKSYADVRNNVKKIEDVPEEFRPEMIRSFKMIDHASIFLKDAYRQMKEMYNRAYKEAGPDDKQKLEAYAQSVKDRVKDLETKPEKMQDFSEVIQEGIKTLNSINAPKIFVPLNEFVNEKSSQTFGNVAFDAWRKYGDKAPIVSIENPPAGGGLSTGAELQKLVETSRQKFVEKAVSEGISKSEAKSAAEKLIGVTWDIGHINMLRKFGYEKEDIIKETDAIKKMVKHVHLSDNFGMEHTELPMGMGNVPTKEIMEKLGKEGFSGKKVIEAFQWWQHMKTPPLIPTLEAFGSPLYPMLNQPTWTQAANTQGNYFQFPSAYLPEQHFSLYGGGFSGLPQELGGQIPGKQSRVTGTPMD